MQCRDLSISHISHAREKYHTRERKMKELRKRINSRHVVSKKIVRERWVAEERERESPKNFLQDSLALSIPLSLWYIKSIH